MDAWEPTRHDGFQRTNAGSSVESAAQIKPRSVVRFHPRVLIRFAEQLGLPECPYVIRWRVETPLGSIRVHHWLGSDDNRAFHDHPWWFLTLVIRGGYTDKSLADDDHLRAGSVRFRKALHQHTVISDDGGCWTVIITGRPLRSWGFWLNGKFRKANKWFLTYGHHPCN
jgi:hypothetical protein